MHKPDGRFLGPRSGRLDSLGARGMACKLTGTGPSRRAFLLSAVSVGALAGCDLLRPPAEPSAPRELELVLVGALDLDTAHQAVIATHPSLGKLLKPLMDNHRAHAERLRKELGNATPTASTSPAKPPVPDTPSGAKRMLAALELVAHRTASAATLSAPARYAELTAAIAACRATHVAVLR